MSDDFYEWKNKIDNIVYKKIGFHLEELADELYRNYFDNGYSIKYMASMVINHYKIEN